MKSPGQQHQEWMQQQHERMRKQQQQDAFRRQQEQARRQQEQMRRQQQEWIRRQQMGAAWLEQQRQKAQQQQARLGRWRMGATPMKPQQPLSGHGRTIKPGYVAGEGPSCFGRLVRVFLYLLIIAAVLYLILAGLGLTLGSGF